jgi:hypothetical protein
MPHRGLKRGELAEVVVHAIELEQGLGSAVTFNAKIPGLRTGDLRQVDVAVETQQAGRTFLRMVEVRDKGRPMATTVLDEIFGKMEDIAAHRATIVSTSGFYRPTIERARQNQHRVDLLHLAKGRPEEWPSRFTFRDLIIERGRLPMTHRRLIDVLTDRPIADVMYTYIGQINGVFCVIVPSGGDARTAVTWIIGNDEGLEGCEIFLAHRDPTAGTAGILRVDAKVNRLPDGQPVTRTQPNDHFFIGQRPVTPSA